MTHAEETDDFDPASLSQPEQYKLLSGSVLPRPIALVTTLGPEGPNAGPFSFFNAVGVLPPMIVFSAGRRSTGGKDTMRNIRASGEFVVHIVDNAAAQKMNVCAIEFGPTVDEIAFAGFRTAPSVKVKPPRLLDCPVQMECRAMHVLEVGTVPYDLVVGEVVYFHFRRGLVDIRGRVDPVALDPLGRHSGPAGYVRMTDLLQMPRLEVPDGMERAR